MTAESRRLTPVGRASGRTSLLPMWGLAVLAGLLLLGTRAEPSAWAAYAAGAVLVTICAGPVMIWGRRSGHGLPMFELICLSYAAQYALPLYTQPDQLVVSSRLVAFTWEQATQSVVLVSTGIAAMIAVYYVTKLLLTRRVDLTFNLPLPGRARVRYIAWGLVIGLGALALSDLGLAPAGVSSLGALFRVAADQTYVVIALLGLGVYRGELSRLWTLALYTAVAAAALLGLASGLLENALIPVTVLAIVYWRGRGAPPIRLLLVGVLLFVLLDSVKAQYRNQAWYGGQRSDVIERLGLWASLSAAEVGHVVAGGSGTQLGSVAQTTGNRLDLLHTFMYVREATPQIVPYYGGATYSYLAYGWIPRFLWPDKPQAQTNATQASVDYGLLSAGSSTTIGLGQPAEAYANFGAPGVVIVLALEGVFFALIDHVLNGSKSQGGAAIYLAVMVFFFNGIGGNTATLFGSVIQDIVAMAIILTLVAAASKEGVGHRAHARSRAASRTRASGGL